MVGAEDDETVLQPVTTEHARVGDSTHTAGAGNRMTTSAAAVTGGALAAPGSTRGARTDDAGQHGACFVLRNPGLGPTNARILRDASAIRCPRAGREGRAAGLRMPTDSMRFELGCYQRIRLKWVPRRCDWK